MDMVQHILVNTKNAKDGVLAQLMVVTEKKALKKSRLSGNPTPANLLAVKTERTLEAIVGGSYQDKVNEQRKVEGSTQDFEAQAGYDIPMDVNKVLYKNPKTGQVYLRAYPQKTITKKIFDSNGIDITAQWAALEAEYFSVSKSGSDSQGVEEVIKVQNYKIDGVKSFELK